MRKELLINIPKKLQLEIGKNIIELLYYLGWNNSIVCYEMKK